MWIKDWYGNLHNSSNLSRIFLHMGRILAEHHQSPVTTLAGSIPEVELQYVYDQISSALREDRDFIDLKAVHQDYFGIPEDEQKESVL